MLRMKLGRDTLRFEGKRVEKVVGNGGTLNLPEEELKPRLEGGTFQDHHSSLEYS